MTRLVLLLLGCSVIWCAGPASTSTSDLVEPPSQMRSLIERYNTDRAALLRAYQVDSPARRERMRTHYGEWLDRLAALDFDRFSQDDRVDYILLRKDLQSQQKQMELEAKRQSESARLYPFANGIFDLEDARRRVDPVDGRKTAATFHALAQQVATLRKHAEADLRSGNANKKAAAIASAEIQKLRAVLQRWFSYYNGYDPMFTWWVPESYQAADTALQGYASFLRERVAGLPPAEMTPAAGGVAGGRRGGQGGPGTSGAPPVAPDIRSDSAEDIVGEPIGREALVAALADEMIAYTPEELIGIANQEFAWCENEMKKASREMDFGDDWKKALEKVKSLHVEPGQQPKLIYDLAVEAIEFLDKHDLITIPQLARETWRMEMMSPQRQLVNPFFTGGETISISYPVNTMNYEQKQMSMRGNNVHFARATVFHELIPGHHLTGFMGQRYRPYRRLFSTPFFNEGWALYWELLLWDMKFPKTPENRVGALFWRMHRCARIIFSLSFHLGKMTPQQAVDFLVNRLGHERDNAIAEVRRSFNGTYPPLYQAAYLLGGIELMALHKELVSSGKMTNRQFHDAILKGNSMPIEMIRVSLTNQKVTRDYSPSWKFYGNVTPASGP
jgi:uncharacterized protein (DUF885 family)